MSWCEYKYQSYFCSYSFKVTICVTGLCRQFSPKTAQFRAGLTARSAVICRTDWRSSNVPETGRPSCKREDHHPRAVAAGDQGPERDQLSPGQCIGEAELSQ